MDNHHFSMGKFTISTGPFSSSQTVNVYQAGYFYLPFRSIWMFISVHICSYLYTVFRLYYPIGSMYGIYANIWGILMVNVTIYI